MLNFASRYCRCSSLKRYAFFACFNAYPSDRATGDSVAEELVAVIVGNELSPSWSIVAYFNFARSSRVSLSIALLHVPNVMCFSSEECLWKARVQPSLGHRNICLSASLSSSSSGSSTEIEQTSFRLVRGATCLKSPRVKELEIF